MLTDFKIAYVIVLFIVTIYLHELVHYIVLKRLGGSGKLTIVRGALKLPTIGIHHTGGLKNWRQVMYWKIAPAPITFICLYYLSFIVVEPSGIMGYLLVLIFGIGLTAIACSQDLKDIGFIILKGNEKNFNEKFKPELGIENES